MVWSLILGCQPESKAPIQHLLEITNLEIHPLTSLHNDATFQCLGNAVDLDNEEIRLHYQWFNNQGSILGEGDQITLHPNSIQPLEELYCQVFATSGSDVVSREVSIVIENRAPSIVSVEITPAEWRIDSTLEPIVVVRDLDDPIEQNPSSMISPDIFYQWLLNDRPISEETRLDLDTVDCTHGDKITLIISASDRHGGETQEQIEGIIINTPPNIANLEIHPNPAFSNDVLQCSASQVNDLENDSLTIQYQWSVNEQIFPEEADSLSEPFAVGDSILCQAIPNDGELDGQPITTEITISNSLPIITSLEINTSSNGHFFNNSMLTCLGHVIEIDPNDALDLEYSWYDSAGLQLSNTDTLDLSLLQRAVGDEISCALLVRDSFGGQSSLTQSIIIENSPPQIDSLIIDIDTPYSNGTITASATLSDIDSQQSPTLSYEWHILDASTNQEIIANHGGNHLYGGAPNHFFGKGDTIFLHATPEDGLSQGIPQISNSIVIENSIPSIPTISVQVWNSSNIVPLAGLDALSCEVTGLSSDIDPEDSIFYHYIWRHENGAILWEEQTIDTQSILDASVTTYGEITCSVEAFDGQSASAMTQSSILVDYDCQCPQSNGRYYAFTYWPINFRHPQFNLLGYRTQRHFLTGFYGVEIEMTSGSILKIGQFQGSSAQNDAQTDNQIIDNFLSSHIDYQINNNGIVHPATIFTNTAQTGNHANDNPSRLLDMGNQLQWLDIPELYYDADGDLLGYWMVSSTPDHLVLTHQVQSSLVKNNFSVEMILSDDFWENLQIADWPIPNQAASVIDLQGDSWLLMASDGSSLAQLSDNTWQVSKNITTLNSNEVLSTSLMIVATTDLPMEQVELYLDPNNAVDILSTQLNQSGTATSNSIPAFWDETRGVFQIDLGNIQGSGASGGANWNVPENHNLYNRHLIEIQNHLSNDLNIPMVFDGPINAIFNITGGVGMLRDELLNPTGIPVQTSKNWHLPGYWPNWIHFYSTPQSPTGTQHLEFTIANSKWGETYAVSHAQLSLVGWGTNQQWDESALGSWGESITYDPDLTLNRAMVDDVRPFLVDAIGQWNWTGNVGGADFLKYIDSNGIHQRLSRMRSNYVAPGPNLSNVHYDGITLDGAIEAHIQTHLVRSNDVVRAFYVLEYDVLEDVEYSRFSLFQVAADNYADNAFTELALGNDSQILEQRSIPAHNTTGYASDTDRGITINGNNGWGFLFNNIRSDGTLPENLADVGFVVRDFWADIGGNLIQQPHFNIYQTNNGNWPQYSIELGLPYDPNDPNTQIIPAGSHISAVIEYLILPNDIMDYYGDSAYLLSLPPSTFATAAIMQYFAANQSSIVVSQGSIQQNIPIILQSTDKQVAVQFELGAGLGYLPLRIDGLHRHDGWDLQIFQSNNAQNPWQSIDQSVHQKDFWQVEYDADAHTYSIIYTLENTQNNEYRLIQTLE